MSTIAIAMVKDEADVIGTTAGWMAGQVDRVLVADNGSSDGTRAILEQLEGVDVIDDPEPGYYQSEKMSRLAELALGAGAEWVVPFDADEIWKPAGGGSIANQLAALPPETDIAEASVLDHVAIRAPHPDAGATFSPWRRGEALPLRKIAARARHGLTIHQGNHGASYTSVDYPLRVVGALEVRHFPYRSAEQMIRKARNGAAAYAATNLDEAVGKHWRDYGKLTDEQITETFETYFSTADPEADDLIYDPAIAWAAT